MSNYKLSKIKWTTDLPDHRDFKYELADLVLPAKVDLRKKCMVVKDQSNLGSCTGQAISGSIELESKKKIQISSLFIYYQEREIEGSISSDSGASIRDGLQACNQIGACSEKLHPYKPASFRNNPSKEAYDDAYKRLIRVYHRIDGIDAVLNCLASGHGVIMGFTVYDSFLSGSVAETGIMTYPEILESRMGGHAVLIVGYNLKKKMLLVRNSWGTKWGQDGYFWMPFKVAENRNMSSDFWTLRMHA